MDMNRKESQLVKSTIPFLREHGETVSDIVYDNLLIQNPQLNNTLNLIHLQDKTLARALTVVILRFASNINNISELIPRLERICQKHCTLGISPPHYAILGTLLVDSFEQVMGPEMTPEKKAAWTKAYKVLSNMLIGREKHIYKDFDRYKWNSWRKFTVERKVTEAQDLESFYLTPTDRKQLPSYMPGQYISLRLFVPEIGYYQTRQYSMSDAPNGGDYYRITVKRERGNPSCHHNPGMISNKLIDKIAVGDEIEVSHPAGDFFLDTTQISSVPVVLISAGGGVTPLMAMLKTVTEANPSRHVSWIHGCRDEVPFFSQLTFLKRRCPNLHTTIFMTSQAGEPYREGTAFDFKGRIDLYKVDPQWLHTKHTGAEYYVCGPESFMKGVARQLKDMGVGDVRIRCQMFTVGEMKLESVCGYVAGKV